MAKTLLCDFITVYLVVMVARAVLSWIPPRQGALVTLYRVLIDVTEPVLAPFRRMIPAAGGLDLSFLVAFFLLFIVRGAICPG